MRTFKIDKDYYTEGEVIFKKNNVTINPGMTILVGCNGTGKTTLLNHISEELRSNNIKYLKFNNLTDGGNNAKDKALNIDNDMLLLATLATSSEGENIKINISNFATKLGKFFSTYKNEKELWVLLDAIDSGLSIDNIDEIKEFIPFILDHEGNGKIKDIYFVISANSYELARGKKCFDVYNCEYITFKDYENYRNFILKSREIKDKRYEATE